MDGKNNGIPIKMDDLGGKTPYFRKHPCIILVKEPFLLYLTMTNQEIQYVSLYNNPSGPLWMAKNQMGNWGHPPENYRLEPKKSPRLESKINFGNSMRVLHVDFPGCVILLIEVISPFL